MHWDPGVSVGNILSIIAIILTMVFGFQKFLAKIRDQYEDQAQHSATVTAAINNLSAITDGLQKAVQTQNGRLAKVETQLAVNEEVERRLQALAGRTS